MEGPMNNASVRIVRFTVLLTVAGLLLGELIAVAPRSPKSKKDEDLLQGDWVLVETTSPNGTVTVHKDGQPDTNHFNLYLQKDRAIFHFDGTDPNDEIVRTFRVDATNQPKAIDFVGIGSTISAYKPKDDQEPAIYRLDGNTLLLACSDKTKKERPTDFKPDQDKAIVVYKFIRSRTPIAQDSPVAYLRPKS
jgi:uncharacterized protein (TIGR03067 family)